MSRAMVTVVATLAMAWIFGGTAARAAEHESPGPGLRSLLETFSGHVAVLPAPGFGELASAPVGRTLSASGLAPHCVLLTPAQFADTNFFQARRFPAALYLGFESYLQTIQRRGDGDEALRHYLAGGGALLVLPAGPLPLFYNERGQAANGAAVVGLNFGAGAFESPPAGLRLFFQVHSNAPLQAWPAAPWPFPTASEADTRWRPSRAPVHAAVRYTPLVTLRDERGGDHGEGAALLEFTQGPLRGGRVLHVWCSLMAADDSRRRVLDGALRWALAGRVPPPTWLRDDFEGRRAVLGEDAVWVLQAGQWTIDQGTLLGRDCVADGFSIGGATRGNLAWRDYELSLRFKIERRGSDWRDGPWLGLRCRPDGDGYYLTFTQLDCQWHKVLYGLSTGDANPLGRAPWKADAQWHSLRVAVRSNHLKVDLDGQRLIEGRDDAHLSLPSLRRGGIVLAARKGSRSEGSTVVRFDDVAVRLLDPE